MVAVDALDPAAERHVVGVANKLDDNVLFLGQVLQGLLDIVDEIISNVDRFRAVTQRRNQVLYTRAVRMPLDVTELTHGLHPADFDTFYLVRNEELL